MIFIIIELDIACHIITFSQKCISLKMNRIQIYIVDGWNLILFRVCFKSFAMSHLYHDAVTIETNIMHLKRCNFFSFVWFSVQKPHLFLLLISFWRNTNNNGKRVKYTGYGLSIHSHYDEKIFFLEAIKKNWWHRQQCIWVRWRKKSIYLIIFRSSDLKTKKTRWIEMRLAKSKIEKLHSVIKIFEAIKSNILIWK